MNNQIKQDIGTQIDHVFLTRFNLPTRGIESLVRAKEGWLRDRQILFEKYCLPSVEQQTKRDFSWIIYFDTQSPVWLQQRISELSSTGIFIPIYRDSVSPEELKADIRARRKPGSTILLTTNLDNDDGLSLDFVERLQDSVMDDTRTARYIPAGLIQNGRKLYLRHDPDNAFCSVSESWADPHTCWVDWHNLLHEHMPVSALGGGPGWLQVIHSGNVSNRVRGRRVPRGVYSQYFAGGLAEVAEPKPGEMLQESLIGTPLRSLREWTRGIAKRAALIVGGKEALDKVKASVSMRSIVRK